LRGEVARAILGEDGVFTIRPEKIHIAEPSQELESDEVSATGHIAEVVYIGPDTRYIVALDAGTELVVTQQNLRTTSSEVLSARGRTVRLVWKRRHCRPIADGRPASEEEPRT
jgi:putative spermidine/putrescine transport system ATP-binding protein